MKTYEDVANADATAITDRLQDQPDRCLAFRDLAMPAGVDPNRVDVGIEFKPASNDFLLVCSPFTYEGGDVELRRLAEQRSVRFLDVDHALAWLKRRLRTSVPASEVTDLTLVAAEQDHPQAPPVDADSLSAALAEEILAQPQALPAVAELIAVHRGQSTPRGPAVAMLIGGTGTGKTATAEAAARITGAPFVRIDLAEYSEAHRISSLLGSPAGYVGHGDRSSLLSTLRNNPHAFVLLDEWEKAHPAVRQALLGFFDVGIITGGDGQTIHAPQAAVFITTNLGAEEISRALDAADGWNDPRVVERVSRTILGDLGTSPELLGRIDDFIAFRSLPAAVVPELAVKAVMELATKFGIEVVWIDPPVVSQVLAARDPRAGARGLHHAARRVTGRALLDAQAASHLTVRLMSVDGHVTSQADVSAISEESGTV